MVLSATRFCFGGLLAGAIILSATRSIALGDTVVLKDGTQYEGTIERQNDGGWIVTLADGRRVLVPLDKVVGLEARPKAGDGVPEQRLASLRRAVEALLDLKQIIERYQSFIKQYQGTPTGEKARADLVIWQDRLDRKLVKIGDKWVTDDERKQLAEKSTAVVEQAMDLLKQNRVKEATPVIDQALIDNPQNAAAWYLRGLLYWKQEKAPEARKAFEQAQALVPDHAATRNDLAVVLWRQNQQVAALISYDKALLAAPLHRAVLDNLAEALYALPPELRNSAAVKKIVRHFNDQDVLLQQQMAAQNMYRWGGTWVGKADYDKLTAAEKEIRTKLGQMEADFEAMSGRVRALNNDISSTENTIRRMEADSYAIDASTGRSVRYPLPPSYYDFVRDLAAMKAERAQRAADQDAMRQKAKALSQSLPTPRYSGVQRMIEYEGAPIFGKPAVAANPALPAAANIPPIAPAPGNGGAPAATQPAVATAPPADPPTSPAAIPTGEVPWPRRPFIPPEKPSILDRRFSDPPPPGTDRPLLDDGPPSR